MAAAGRAEQDRARLLKGRLEFAERLSTQLSNPLSVASQSIAAYSELLDSCLLDVAVEVHRAVRTGESLPAPETEVGQTSGRIPFRGDELEEIMQRNWAPSAASGIKVTEDVFGQQHPPVASELVECMNCGRKVVAGRFAPHLEKCLGKGRVGVRAASRRRQKVIVDY
eukprot:CAMPEP_0177752730 /NCGR_PEP_ID=MMETSP0491_2-20121128/1073_1 /TAXON_ID=63592 /ORGANISM="Tetraselmis chuii, Strain PLY429" /LENGTH=167 /DNA_ID=CAMNT_0019267949 /DNA_START=135 /DNA_END=638 /DNA_ORIENTATION=-